MAVNNWVYLPESAGEYINLDRVQRVLTMNSERVLVDFAGEVNYRAYTGEDAKALIAALAKRVNDGK